MIVKLKKPVPRNPDLTFGQPYAVIGIEADELRIINNTGRPFLYPADLFLLVDAREPADWVTEFGEDGERYSYPLARSKPGFVEDFFDQKTKAVTTFWRVVNHSLAARNSDLKRNSKKVSDERVGMEAKHNGFVIDSVSWARADTGKFKCRVSILKYAPESVTESRPYFLEEEFDTQDEAEQFGVRFCIDVIDRKIPRW